MLFIIGNLIVATSIVAAAIIIARSIYKLAEDFQRPTSPSAALPLAAPPELLSKKQIENNSQGQSNMEEKMDMARAELQAKLASRIPSHVSAISFEETDSDDNIEDSAAKLRGISKNEKV